MKAPAGTLDDEPYLSIVVTARNDDHGGNPLYRMQAFVDSLLRQCDSCRLPSELIIVEWNPPKDRPRLGDVLTWPKTTGWCSVRIIEVPNELHSELQHSESLPLFQMIAKNVGIRRATGAFVLATNIDLIFDNGLIERIAARRLQTGRLYRVDRYDVPGTIAAPPEEWLGWCRRSVTRIHAAHGSVDVRTGDYYPIGRHSRISQSIRAAVGRRPRLMLAIRRAEASVDEVFEPLFGAHSVAEAARRGREAGQGFGNAIAIAALRSIFWIADALSEAWFLVKRGLRFVRDLLWLLRAFTYWFWCGVREPRLLPRRAARRLRRIGPALIAQARAFGTSGRQATPAGIRARQDRQLQIARIQGMLATWRIRRALPPLHTNACGDFTLLARTDWERTLAYPELQRFSMHIDGLFLFQAHHAGIRERLLPYPTFHLEHASGFRPDTASVRELDERLERDRIKQITDQEFLEWVVEMQSTGGPLPFNDDNWGFRDVNLPEYNPLQPAEAVAS